MARVERLTCYPVKGLDGLDCEETRILPGGTLAHDRTYQLVDEDGDLLNGKRTARVHELTATYDPSAAELTVEAPTEADARDAPIVDEQCTFDLERECEAAAAWFSEFFEASLTLERAGETGFVDRPEMGPSVISTATLEEVASWYDEVTVEGARRRLRANVEVGGVPAFWEDRFVGADAPAFEVGDVRFEGLTPCGRCVVPSRDPDTGEQTLEFRQRFVQRREETFPEWADRDAFDHFFTVMLIASVPEADRGATIATDDPVRVVEP